MKIDARPLSLAQRRRLDRFWTVLDAVIAAVAVGFLGALIATPIFGA